MPVSLAIPSTVAPSVHLLAGLPTDCVCRAFDRVRDLLPVRSFAGFVGSPAIEGGPIGVVLPPCIEMSQVVEDWEAIGFLERRFGSGARIGNVVTFVDCAGVRDQLDSADSLSARGWGKSDRDTRSVADIVAGQVESASHLILVGDSKCCTFVSPLLDVLNPSAERLILDDTSDVRLSRWLMGSLGQEGDASARVVPPWLDLLQAERPPLAAPDRFLYRRSRPFDPEHFGDWLAHAPRSLVRGKGSVWLADKCDQTFGYSCAGSVHRLFAAGRWWASDEGKSWPTCDVARRRLFDRWHPHFGDRRQEIAFLGVDLDADAICSELDRCLLSEDEALDVVLDSRVPLGVSESVSSSVGLH